MLFNSQVYGITRSQLMTRAWQLACLNRRTTATASLKLNFGRWLSLAWAEAREGNTALWPVNFSRRDALQHEIDCLGAKDRWDNADYQMADMLSAAMRALSAPLASFPQTSPSQPAKEDRYGEPDSPQGDRRNGSDSSWPAAA